MMIMQTPYSTTHILKPTWSRLLHRMHTIGHSKQQYRNSLATITSEGDYPRLLTNALEDKSYSLSGDQQWLLDHWQQGIVKVNSHFQQAEFQFLSEAGEIFHKITLTPKSHWECFECLLKLFESARIEHTSQIEEQQPQSAINRNIAHVAKAVNREIIRGKRLLCSLPISGGSTLKNLEIKSLMTQFGRVALKSANTHLQINSNEVTHVETIVKSHTFITTLFNAQSEPQLSIQAI